MPIACAVHAAVLQQIMAPSADYCTLVISAILILMSPLVVISASIYIELTDNSWLACSYAVAGLVSNSLWIWLYFSVMYRG